MWRASKYCFFMAWMKLRASSSQQEIRTEEADYAEHVTLHLLLPPEEVEARLTELQDLTSANFQAEKGETRRIALPC